MLNIPAVTSITAVADFPAIAGFPAVAGVLAVAGVPAVAGIPSASGYPVVASISAAIGNLEYLLFINRHKTSGQLSVYCGREILENRL